MIGSAPSEVPPAIVFGAILAPFVPGLSEYLIIGGCLWASSFIYNAMTDWSRERMLVKWKCLYLKAIVRQDVGWYDTNNPTELAPRIGEATKLIEEGMGGKAMIFFEWVGMGISGLVLCFYYNWAVGLVVLACG